MGKIELIKGDCLEKMKSIADCSIDMILCDLPYGVTAKNKWDNVINPDLLWEQYNRVIKQNGAIVLFGQDKFTAEMMLSNRKMHRYNLIWKKILPSGFLNANRMPLREHEDIMVFYKKLPTYNAQKFKGKPSHSKGKVVGNMNDAQLKNNNYGDFKCVETTGDMKFPTSVLEFSKPHPSVVLHPTQKPVDLLQFLVKSFTNEGETVMDNTMGSCSTGIACLDTGRSFIGIEMDDTYFEVSKNRIEKYILDNNLEDIELKISC